IAMLNELNQFAILFFAHNPTGFSADQAHGLVSLFLNMHENGVLIGGIFWGLWLVPYGMLVFRSGFLPRIFGILLIVECFGFLIQSFAGFLWPNLDTGLALLPAITAWAELLVPLWLVIRGINVELWKKRAFALTS
ncbi:MAG TPA: DUF4386 domain-containing protein, partial [Ktedonobacterales bacterium]|nr:DUF4386 domain-containing protein [Ktedonobacterales bacterium]